MSRTFRLRRLRQPEGGRNARRFVDARVRFPSDVAEEAFLSHLAHVELERPCVLQGGPSARNRGWNQTHARCLPPGYRDLLWGARQSSRYWHLGWTRVLWASAHPAVGYGLTCVPSATKKENRKLIYRRNRRKTKRLLRVVRWTDYTDAIYDPPKPLAGSGLELDWEDMTFPDVERELAEDRYRLT